jgi:hypothetical protein
VEAVAEAQPTTHSAAKAVQGVADFKPPLAQVDLLLQ